jgi:hypothetical protein
LHFLRAMEIVYAAHTRSGVFMLDADGVCRWAVAQPGRTAEKVPERIVGAQYLATLDVNAEGALVDLPRIGCPMLFAATDEKGRVRLVRTPPLLRFEDRRNGPTRKPLASKFDADDATPALPLPRSSSVPPPPSVPESMPVPLTRPTTVTRPVVPLGPSASSLPPPSVPAPSLPAPLPPPRTPLPPPPRARIAARIPPAPPTLPLASTGSGARALPGVQSIPVRTRAANMSLKKLARGNR